MESAIETEPKGVWRWSQPLDIAHAREFHAEALEVLTPERTGQLLLDLRDSVYMDACGLQLLIAIAVQALSQGRFFEISRASFAITRGLQLTGVGYLLKQPPQ